MDYKLQCRNIRLIRLAPIWEIALAAILFKYFVHGFLYLTQI